VLVNVFSKLLGAAAVCLLVSSATLAEEQEFAGNYQLISAPREKFSIPDRSRTRLARSQRG